MTTYELELHPIGPDRYRADLVHGVMRETLLVNGGNAIRQSATALMNRGASPLDELVVRTAGSETVEVHRTLGWLAAKVEATGRGEATPAMSELEATRRLR